MPSLVTHLVPDSGSGLLPPGAGVVGRWVCAGSPERARQLVQPRRPREGASSWPVGGQRRDGRALWAGVEGHSLLCAQDSSRGGEGEPWPRVWPEDRKSVSPGTSWKCRAQAHFHKSLGIQAATRAGRPQRPRHVRPQPGEGGEECSRSRKNIQGQTRGPGGGDLSVKRWPWGRCWLFLAPFLGDHPSVSQDGGLSGVT